MSASTRTGSLLRKAFTTHVALGVAFVIVLSSLGAYFAASGSATPTQQLNMVAPAAPPSAVPSIAPKTPTPATAAPKPVTKVAPKVVYRAPVRSSSSAPAVVHHATATGGSEMKTALIIGVGNPVGAQALPGADADARNERQALINDGFPAGNIQMLIDSQATRASILNGLTSLANRTSRSGTAVFAVSTHSSQDSFRTYEGNRITRSQVASAIGRIPGRVLSIFAVCFADSYNTPGVTGPNHVAVFSSAGGEETWENSQGSDFIRGFVLEAMLEHKAANDSVEAAFTYADHEMLAAGSGHPSINDQVPGNFVLSR
jgi:hypothetical protein